MTFKVPRRVMGALSPRPLHLVKLASLGVGLTVAAPALAQLPVYESRELPESPEVVPAPPAPPAGEGVAPPSAPMALAPTPSAPLPAKTAVITEQHRAVSAP
ncbi:MAG TPA: hypothetical protein VEQ59_11915, partial [Polyangiaceae bacterium]|nr:hypothetical protein [Polyangiaceae bacterium]